MKKRPPTLVLTLAALIAFAVCSRAQNPVDDYISMFTGIIDDFVVVLCDIAGVVQTVIGVVAVMVIVFAGANYVFSADNPQERTEAKERVFHAVIGLAILIAAKVFVSWFVVLMNVNLCP